MFQVPSEDTGSVKFRLRPDELNRGDDSFEKCSILEENRFTPSDHLGNSRSSRPANEGGGRVQLFQSQLR